MFPKIQRNFSKIFNKIILLKNLSRFWSDYKKVPEKNLENFKQIFKKFQKILQNKWNCSKNLRKIRYLNLKTDACAGTHGWSETF